MGELRTLALCAGIGGLELGLRRVLPTRVVCWVERDPYAQRALLARMADGRLDDAPLWDDLTTFDAAAWRGHVDLVAAGFPCQPYSTAGKKLGAADARDLWSHVARVVAESRPSLVALENVARLVRAPGGLGRVLRDLAALGFNAEWGVVRASDAGAPHRRARLFLLAVSDAGRGLLLREQGRWGREGSTRLESGREGDLGEEPVAHSDGSGRSSSRQPQCHGVQDGTDAPRGEPDGRGGEAVEHADGPGREGLQKAHEWRAEPGFRLPAWPPGPGDRAGWERVLLKRPDLEPSVRGVAHGPGDGLDRDAKGRIRDRRPRLRCLGNAVCPAQAALAFGELARRVGDVSAH